MVEQAEQMKLIAEEASENKLQHLLNPYDQSVVSGSQRGSDDDSSGYEDSSSAAIN